MEQLDRNLDRVVRVLAIERTREPQDTRPIVHVVSAEALR
jgi:hypothetical protein